jgi:hypothetical protein
MFRLKSDRRLACAVMLLTLAVPGGLAATTIVAKSFTDLCREADKIFVGTVADVTSQWKDRARMEIETLVRFTNVTPIDGSGGDDVTLRFGGGEMEGIREEIAGIPQFEPGQRVVVFARDGMSINPIVGFRQGLFRVVDDSRGPVVADADRRPVIAIENGDLRLGKPEDGVGTALSLEQFLQRVRETRGASR